MDAPLIHKNFIGRIFFFHNFFGKDFRTTAFFSFQDGNFFAEGFLLFDLGLFKVKQTLFVSADLETQIGIF